MTALRRGPRPRSYLAFPDWNESASSRFFVCYCRQTMPEFNDFIRGPTVPCQVVQYISPTSEFLHVKSKVKQAKAGGRHKPKKWSILGSRRQGPATGTPGSWSLPPGSMLLPEQDSCPPYSEYVKRPSKGLRWTTDQQTLPRDLLYYL